MNEVPSIVDIHNLDRNGDLLVTLTSREFLVARRRSNGSSFADIAKELDVSETRVSQLYDKASMHIKFAAYYVLNRLGLSDELLYVALLAVDWCILRGRCPDSLMMPMIAKQAKMSGDRIESLLNRAISYVKRYGESDFIMEVFAKKNTVPSEITEFLYVVCQYTELQLCRGEPLHFAKLKN